MEGSGSTLDPLKVAKSTSVDITYDSGLIDTITSEYAVNADKVTTLNYTGEDITTIVSVQDGITITKNITYDVNGNIFITTT
jgi:hypothetical protein